MRTRRTTAAVLVGSAVALGLATAGPAAAAEPTGTRVTATDPAGTRVTGADPGGTRVTDRDLRKVGAEVTAGPVIAGGAAATVVGTAGS